jgi:hypothetical protein
MNRGKIYFFIFIATILGMVSLQLKLHQRLYRRTDRVKQTLPTVESLIKVEQAKPVVVEKTLEQKKWDETVSSEFLTQFKQESEQAQRPQKNIEEHENRLQSWARHLDENEIDFLSAVVKDRSRHGDERTLALDLLGRNQSSKSLEYLKDFVLTKGGRSRDVRARIDEELILKVQAVEDIASSSSSVEAISFLNEIQKKTDQSFVKDRAQRSLSSLKGLAPSTESQDNEVLKK